MSLFGKKLSNVLPKIVISEAAKHAAWEVYHDKIAMRCFANPSKKLAELQALQRWIDGLSDPEAKAAYNYWMPHFVRCATDDLKREKVRQDAAILAAEGFPKP